MIAGKTRPFWRLRSDQRRLLSAHHWNTSSMPGAEKIDRLSVGLSAAASTDEAFNVIVAVGRPVSSCCAMFYSTWPELPQAHVDRASDDSGYECLLRVSETDRTCPSRWRDIAAVRVRRLLQQPYQNSQNCVVVQVTWATLAQYIGRKLKNARVEVIDSDVVGRTEQPEKGCAQHRTVADLHFWVLARAQRVGVAPDGNARD